MTRVLLPMWLICTTATAAMAQEDDTTPVYDFGESGGVVVYDSGYTQQQQNNGRLTVVQNDYGAADGQYWFYGPHPDGAGGWCSDPAAHSHEYPPFDEYLFTQENGYYYFIGDPADFGYGQDDLYGYYGSHPIALAYGGGYCYYGGYHHHWWPAWGSYFAVTDGWYLYNGPFSPWYWSYRDRYADYFRNVYPNRRITVARPPTVTHPPPRQPPPRVGQAAFAGPIQRMRTPAAPARAGWGYVTPARPTVMRPVMPQRPIHGAPVRLQPAARPVPAPRPTAPVHYAPVHAAPAPARAAPAPSRRR